MIPDPTPFVGFGVLGGLLFAVVVMALLVWRLFDKQSKMFESRDELLMGFVNNHRKETTSSMETVASKVSESHDRLGNTIQAALDGIKEVLSRNTRRLDEVLLTREVMSKIESAKRRGESLDDTVVEKVIRGVADEMQRRDKK